MNVMSNLDYSFRSPGELKSRTRDYRVHPKAQIDRLCRSITEYGFNQPVAIDSEDRIVCGAALVEAARRLGMNRVPVVRLDHLDEGQLRAYAVAANKLAEWGGYDETLLALEVADITGLLGAAELPEDTSELDRILGLSVLNDDSERTVDEPGASVSQPGDRWLCGAHVMQCSDALVGDSYDRLMGDERAQFVISDVPYNLSADDISTKGAEKLGDFVQAYGEFDGAQFTRFLTTGLRHMAAYSQDGSIHMIFMSWHFLYELLRAGRVARAMEIDPRFVDASIRRFRKATGIEPVCSLTGEKFADRETAAANIAADIGSNNDG